MINRWNKVVTLSYYFMTENTKKENIFEKTMRLKQEFQDAAYEYALLLKCDSVIISGELMKKEPIKIEFRSGVHYKLD
jgi:hypothetical protein